MSIIKLIVWLFEQGLSGNHADLGFLMLLHFGQAEAPALIHRLAFAQLHLTDAMRPPGIAAIAHVLDEEGAGSQYREQDLTRPLVRNMRWAHHQSGT